MNKSIFDLKRIEAVRWWLLRCSSTTLNAKMRRSVVARLSCRSWCTVVVKTVATVIVIADNRSSITSRTTILAKRMIIVSRKGIFVVLSSCLVWELAVRKIIINILVHRNLNLKVFVKYYVTYSLILKFVHYFIFDRSPFLFPFS